jgi:hypothetical protein
VLDALTDAVGDDLEDTEFRRVPLFYSLFCAACHRMYGMPRVRGSSRCPRLINI